MALRSIWILWFLIIPIGLSAQTNVRIPVADRIQLHGRIYYPPEQEAAPAIILLNPWSIGGEIYGLKARQWAAKGFVVLTYNLRGWLGSEGEADVGGPNDMQDVSRIVDWLEQNPRVDAKAIGIGGVSLGAGVSLLAAAHEPRLRAVTALSGWANLYAPIYGYNTQRPYWDKILLVGSIVGTGSPAASHTKEIREAIAAQDYARIHAYSDPRSPDLYLDRYAANQTAVLISHNYSDILFPIADVWNFFNALQVPKKFMVQQGVHGSTEVAGMLGGGPDAVWDSALEWFERWLKHAPAFRFERTSEWDIRLDDRRITVDQTDELNKSKPRYALDSHAIRFSKKSGINSGIPLIYPLVSQCEILHPKINSQSIDPTLAAVYPLMKAANDIDLIGIPRLNLLVKILRGDSLQIVAHLFRVTEKDDWDLISMTPYTLRSAQADQSYNLDFALYGAFSALHKGDQLVLAIDTYDPEFSSPGKDFAFTIEADESWVEVPFSVVSGPSRTPVAAVSSTFSRALEGQANP